jgi:hypothetical protein
LDSEWIVKFTVQKDCPVVGQNLYFLREWDFDEFILTIGWFIWVDILCAGPMACLLSRWILLGIDFTIWCYKESYEPCNYGFCISALETMCDCLKYVVFGVIVMRLASLGCLQHVVWGLVRA